VGNKPLLIHKLPPDLWMTAAYSPDVLPGQPATFALTYGNTGGYENDTMLRAVFPADASFQQSVPAPDRVDPAGLWAEWDLGDLPQGAQGSIDVTALIAPDVPWFAALEVTADLYNHVGVVRASTAVQWTVQCQDCLIWDKQVNGQPWQSGVPVTVQTADTLTVVESIIGSDFGLVEAWASDRLELIDYQASEGDVVVGAGSLEWTLPPGTVVPHTLTQHYRVLPCTWTDTTLGEALWQGGAQVSAKPVLVHKLPPDLWMTADYSQYVLPGQPAAFTLTYGNTGGYENDTMLRVAFPTDAPFQQSVPAPSRLDPAGLWAEWDLGDLPQGAHASIDVTALIAADAPWGGTLEVTADLYDHVDVVRASAAVLWTVEQSPTRYVFLPLVDRSR
jgi:hypothetical protein